MMLIIIQKLFTHTLHTPSLYLSLLINRYFLINAIILTPPSDSPRDNSPTIFHLYTHLFCTPLQATIVQSLKRSSNKSLLQQYFTEKMTSDCQLYLCFFPPFGEPPLSHSLFISCYLLLLLSTFFYDDAEEEKNG